MRAARRSPRLPARRGQIQRVSPARLSFHRGLRAPLGAARRLARRLARRRVPRRLRSRSRRPRAFALRGALGVADAAARAAPARVRGDRAGSGRSVRGADAVRPFTPPTHTTTHTSTHTSTQRSVRGADAVRAAPLPHHHLGQFDRTPLDPDTPPFTPPPPTSTSTSTPTLPPPPHLPPPPLLTPPTHP